MASAKALLSKLKPAQSKFNIFTSIRSEAQLQADLDQMPSSTVLAAIKDNFVTKQDPTTCSSRVLKDYVSPFEATAVELLKENGDAVIVGKTNMDEFGMGSGTTKSIFGPTFNPLYPIEEKRICGGSSGGSAAAVASGAVDIALGTDTGGSVRLPAAYTGTYGFKPSYGRISRWGVVAYAQSLDTVGILANDLGLLSNVFKKLDRYDPKDPTSLLPEVRASLSTTKKDRGFRIGIPVEFVLDNLSENVLNVWKESILKLSENHTIVPISIPTLKYSLPIYYTIAPSEASSNLARYDGIRYGFRSDNDKNNYAKTRTLGFNKEVQNRIILGNYNLNADSFKNHFLKAKNLRSQLIEEFNQVFNLSRNQYTESRDDGVDLILSPTSMTTAPTLDEFESQTSVEVYTNDTLTVPASLAGLPAISIPWNPAKDSEPPVGLQIIGQFGDDEFVLQFAKVLKELNSNSN